jgi:hypothetical protein
LGYVSSKVRTSLNVPSSKGVSADCKAGGPEIDNRIQPGVLQILTAKSGRTSHQDQR